MLPEFAKNEAEIPKARLVVLKSVYHQVAGQSPTLLPPVNFSRNLASDEQAYTREMPVGEEWVQIERGWVEDVGYLAVANQEGTLIPTNASREESSLAQSRRLLVGMRIGTEIVTLTALAPNEGIDLDPYPGTFDLLRVKWSHRPGRASIRVYPR